MKSKKLPIGIDGFEKIRSNNFYYVDKTMFIAELLQNWGEVNLFTRPRRFGKSLNMSMLKCFFEIGCDRKLFEGLQIAGKEELCEEYMGKFPVISISLKSVDGLDFEAAAAGLRTVIGDEAMRFQFLQDSKQLSSAEKDSYRRLIQVDIKSESNYVMSESALIGSLKMLSRLLAKHYGRKVILLIDEYDVPLDKAFQNGYYDEMIILIRNMFGNALKTNDNLYFSVLTGCLRISKESIFTGLNNLKVHTISDSRYDEYFGFTNEDVDELLSFYGLTEDKEVIRDWYNGYLFGKVSVYCPWDVINYCDVLLSDRDAEPENYWANTSGNDIVRRLLKRADQTTRDEIERLIGGGTIIKTIRQELTYRDIEDSIDNIWSVLYSTGYLTQRGRFSGKQMKLALPNREVRELFIDLVKDWFQETTHGDLTRINRFCGAFPEGKVKVIQDMLHDYLWDSISVRDTAVRTGMKENFYHGMLLGLLRSQGSWLIQSNEETGEGYSDISICTPDRNGIVIEIKYADNGDLESACQRALEQIEEKKYGVSLLRRGMKKILKYGIAFCGKECMVVMAS
ncbi:hypothetical protein HNP82_002448 [Catenibacillus scindens]|uniref:AAA-ATPase-like domain-containing protein n=1 Tax=Catenibacillus scindens TaxID=673271 RepID=A0A7W8HBM5_9FIRM|nr:AAA family ATPase [Catenibacillus scindens]MBB5265305.1 hypothetical protein [Catenibacillus scindens]